MKTAKIIIQGEVGIYSPEHGKKINGEQVVPLTTYWLRRIRMGDVTIASEKQIEKAIEKTLKKEV